MNRAETVAARQTFAVVPAAGHSKRMGRPKLLLPAHHGETIMDVVLASWQPCVSRVFVVVRRDDRELQRCCEQHDVQVVLADTDPPDMKASVLMALRQIQARHTPQDTDPWFIAPADLPQLAQALIQQMLASYDRRDPRVIVASHGGRRGHPVLFPWSFAPRVAQLQHDQGIRDLIPATAQSVEWSDPLAFRDVDTPADYAEYRNDPLLKCRGAEFPDVSC
jgi:molybdenum cofactor cytidylyltransferase